MKRGLRQATLGVLAAGALIFTLSPDKKPSLERLCTPPLTAHYELRAQHQQAIPAKKQLREALLAQGHREGLIDSTLQAATLDAYVIDRYTPRTTTQRTRTPFQERLDNYLAHPNLQAVQEQLPYYTLQHLDQLLRLEEETGVDYRYVAAIHGLESRFGAFTGNHQLINTYLSRWHVRPGNRQVMRELNELLTWSDENGVDATQLNNIPASWASAIGGMQTRATNLRTIPGLNSLEDLTDAAKAQRFITDYLTNNYRWGASSNWRRSRGAPTHWNTGNGRAIRAYNNDAVYVNVVMHLAQQLPPSNQLTNAQTTPTQLPTRRHASARR